MTLLKIDLGLTGITVVGMAVSVIHQNLTITPAFESEEKDNPPFLSPIKSIDTQLPKVIGTNHIIQPEKPVCNEMRQLITDASIHAANLSMKELYKVFMYGNYHFN